MGFVRVRVGFTIIINIQWIIVQRKEMCNGKCAMGNGSRRPNGGAEYWKQAHMHISGVSNDLNIG